MCENVLRSASRAIISHISTSRATERVNEAPCDESSGTQRPSNRREAPAPLARFFIIFKTLTYIGGPLLSKTEYLPALVWKPPNREVPSG